MINQSKIRDQIDLFHQYQVDNKIHAATELLKTLCDESLIDVDLDSYERDFGSKVKPDPPEELNEALLKVNVADRNNKCTCWIKVEQHISVQNFRSLLFEAFGFPIRFQVLYTKEDILNDEAVLTERIAKQDKKKYYQVELFLKESWLTKRRNEEFQSWSYARKLLPDYEAEEEKVEVIEEQETIVEEPKNTQSLVEQLQQTFEGVAADILLNTMLDNTEAPVPRITGETWICAACTFENEAWRPGCEICSADRS